MQCVGLARVQVKGTTARRKIPPRLAVKVKSKEMAQIYLAHLTGVI